MAMIADIEDYFTRGCGRCDRFDTPDCSIQQWKEGQNKLRQMRGFLEDGDKVKVTLRFRGREMAHQNLGMELLQKVKGDTETIAKVEAEPKLEGRQMMMVLAPR